MPAVFSKHITAFLHETILWAIAVISKVSQGDMDMAGMATKH